MQIQWKKYLNFSFRFDFLFRIIEKHEIEFFSCLYFHDSLECRIAFQLEYKTHWSCMLRNAICFAIMKNRVLVFYFEYFLYSLFEYNFLYSFFKNEICCLNVDFGESIFKHSKIALYNFRQIFYSNFTILFSPFHWRRWTKM